MVLYWLRQEHIQRRVRLLCRAWLLYAHAAGISVLSVVAAFGLAWVFDTREAVFEHSSTISPILITPRVREGGELRYIVHTRMNRACPGDIVTTYTSKDEPPAVITLRRPITRRDIGTYKDFQVNTQIPRTVFAGQWVVTIAADSRCQLRSVVSKIAEFNVEVYRDDRFSDIDH